MRKIVFFLSILIFITACKNQEEAQKPPTTESHNPSSVKVKYAKGFKIEALGPAKIITLKNPWPGTDKTFKYALVDKNTEIQDPEKYDAVVKVPVSQIVVTSTTHIPSLEMLGELGALVGFPNLDYISSEKTRQYISEGKIAELGKNEDLNTEILIDLNPGAVIGFAVDGNNSTFTTLRKTGIPVLYNSDWTESSPLGKAEWIKFFGALFNKEEEANRIFNNIETDYLATKKLAATAVNKPTVISGAMYKDVWYMPQGNSWGAQFIADANGDYLWKDTKGTGSLSLNLESVLDKGQHADYWIGPGQFTSLESLRNSSGVYAQFKAYKQEHIYTYSMKKGASGGVVYFELAPNRPDWVLKDLVKILHPELYPDHQLYFFNKLQ